MSQNQSVAVESAGASQAAVPEPAEFLGLISDKLEAVERLLEELSDTDVPFIQSANDYIFSGGGKRVRPALLLLVARALGRDGESEVTYGAVVEMIHNATLVHDDVIDRSSLRRGRPTVGQVWDNSRTVLLGDWLYTKSMKMALEHDNLEVIRRLCDACLRMTEGELLALERLGKTDLTFEEYFSIIRRKTSNLFGAACSIPALIQPIAASEVEALERYGLNLGICFQLVDDLLDFTAKESDLGKPVLSDLKGGKLTLPLILALPRLTAEDRRGIECVLEDCDFTRCSSADVLAMVASHGTLEEVHEMASSYASEATHALAGLAPSSARDALEFAPEFVLNRRS